MIQKSGSNNGKINKRVKSNILNEYYSYNMNEMIYGWYLYIHNDNFNVNAFKKGKQEGLFTNNFINNLRIEKSILFLSTSKKNKL